MNKDFLKFFKSVGIFTFFLIALFIFLSLFTLILPVTPKNSKSALFSSLIKEKLLKENPTPRIIFIGGSSVSYGLNSQKFIEKLGLNPINTAISYGIGLKYMLDSTLDYIKVGDIVVLMPEYEHYFEADINSVSETLVHLIFDVDKSRLKYLNIKQKLNLIPLYPKYAISKVMPTQYLLPLEDPAFSVNSFNKYGDNIGHWGLPSPSFSPVSEGSKVASINSEVLRQIHSYENDLAKKGAILFISFPGIQDISYDRLKERIGMVWKALKEEKFKLLGFPERYKMPDEYMYDTIYHLTKEGADYRTNLLIEDIQSELSLR